MAACGSHMTKLRYLLHFAQEHVDFRLHEIKSIARAFGIDMKLSEGSYDIKNPFIVVDLPGEESAKKLMSRTVLVRAIYELWSKGSTQRELNNGLRKLSQDFLKPYLHQSKSFKINVETFNKKLSGGDKVKKIDELPADILAFEGKVDLSNPDNTFSLMEFYEFRCNKPEKDPREIYFGRLIADGQRDLPHKFNLQKRKFIANTSMDPQLSLIMANMGKVKAGSFVYDPFVGSGSLLVACSYFGGYVVGSEIDYMLIHGRGKSSRKGQKWRQPDENVRANLSQYGLEHYYVDVMVADASRHQMWRRPHDGMFDAIITDPPYGIREGAKKVGTHKEVIEISDEQREGHIPQNIQYDLSDIYKDLLNMAARSLRLHGRLVYWLPIDKETYTDDHVPRHSCLELISNCEQPLSERFARKLITMEKVKHYHEIEDENSAHYVEDSFKELSFREKYFRPASKDNPKKTNNSNKNASKITEAKTRVSNAETELYQGQMEADSTHSEHRNELSEQRTVNSEHITNISESDDQEDLDERDKCSGISPR